MPRLPIDYSKCVIYRFVCNDTLITDTYVGHTTDMTRRKYYHKKACCNEKNKAYNFKLYKNIRANGNWENWEMKPLEEFACENKIQACIREQYWIDTLQAKLNDRRANTDRKEYMKKYNEGYKEEKKIYNEEHKEEQKLYFAERYGKNKETISEKRKEKLTCECGSNCRIADKSRHEKSPKHINYIANI